MASPLKAKIGLEIDYLKKLHMATRKEGTYFGLVFLMVIGISFPIVAFYLTYNQPSVSHSTTLGMTKGIARITNKTESPTTTVSTETTTETLCLESLWKNDGFCDDLTNVQDCDYDGGDCCLVPSLGHYCDNCTCHETLESHVATTLTPPSKFKKQYLLTIDNMRAEFFSGKCNTPTNMYVQDGYCDDDNNIQECNFDGGDCCLEEVLEDYCSICACLEKQD